MKVDLSCPIELWEYELPTAEKPVCSFTFFNLGQKTISSIQITITFFDAKDEVLSRRVERPMALDAAGRQTFVVEIAGEDLPIEAVDLAIDKCWYEDGSEWRRQQDVRLVDYEPNELPPNRQLEQLRYVAGNDAVGFPSDQGSVWICVCGRVNAAEEETCRRCDRSKEEVFDRYTEDAVQDIIDERERELQEKARMAREEASRQEFMRQEKARRKKRARRTRTAIISAVLIIAVFSYLFIVLGLPELRYQSAMSALASHELASARSSFVELMDYRDSADMVKECDLRLATDYANSGDMGKVDTALAMLDELGNYPGTSEMVQTATYQKGLLYMDDGDYADASKIFRAMGSYNNAEGLANESDYQLANAAMENMEYEDAAERFNALGNYLDSAALARECVYRPAVALMNQGNFTEAAEMFAEIVGYKDANDMRLQSLYRDALKAQLAGDHDYAAERFAMLGNYEDAPEQVKHSIYLAANTARDAGKYETAVRLYTTVSDYQDAEEQIKACTYLPGKALMTEGRYDEAAKLFVQIPTYLDAGELYNSCLYIPAMAHMEAGEYEEAIALFDQIPEYSDVAKQLPLAHYKLAEKLEEDGKLDDAIKAFAALGDYSDAADREQAAQYKLAEEAFDAGQFSLASQRFTDLGRYKDARTRVKQCAYELAMLLFDSGDYEGAYTAFGEITDYDPAKEKMRESAYSLGEKRTTDGDLEGAADAFGLAGRYEDAAERQKDSIYEWALTLMESEDYQQAGELFNSILGYTDARAKRDESYDLWLSGLAEEAGTLYDDGEYADVVALLKDTPMDDLPKAYANIETMYRDANLKIARRLIADNKSLEAYGYLISAKGYRNANELLDKNIYRILGTWETEEGTRYAFFLNGTANLNGETVFFNMFNQNPYGIFTGSSSDTDTMDRTMSYISGGANTIRLREDATQKNLVLSRVKAPEVSPTNDSSGTALPTEEQTLTTDPIVDEFQVGGTGSGTDVGEQDATPADGDDEAFDEEEADG